jgi:hypothetical protein
MLPHTAWKNKPTDNIAEQCPAILQAVRHRSVTMKAQVLTQASPCGIYVGQSGNGTGFSHKTSVFHGQYHSTNSPHSCTDTHSLIHSSTIYVTSLTMLLHYTPKQAVVIILQVEDILCSKFSSLTSCGPSATIRSSITANLNADYNTDVTCNDNKVTLSIIEAQPSTQNFMYVYIFYPDNMHPKTSQ